MTQDKLVFTFGIGAVLTTACSNSGTLALTQIKPPLNYLGTIQKGDLDNVENLYSVTFNRKEHGESLLKLKDTLLNIKEGQVLEFENVLLDFTKFEQQSIDIVRKGIIQAMNPYWQIALAC